MFLDDLSKAVTQKKWGNRNTMNSLLKMPIGGPQDRFNLLVEVISYKWALDFPRWNIRQTKLNPKFVTNELYKAAQYMQNPKLIAAVMRNICEILSQEFKDTKIDFEALKKWDVEKAIKIKEEFENFTVDLPDQTQLLITDQTDVKNLWKEKLEFVFNNIVPEEHKSIFEWMHFMKAMWIKIDMICAYYQKGDVIESKKLQECLKEKLS